MFASLPLMFAFGVADLIQYLVPFVFLIVWVVSQIMEAKKKAGPPVPRQQPANPPPAEQNPRPLAAGGEGPAHPAADSLRDQVDEFLRRAGRAEKGQDQRAPKQRGRGAATNDIEILLDEERATSRPERSAKRQRPMQRAAAAQSAGNASPSEPSLRAPVSRGESPLSRGPVWIDGGARTEKFEASRLGQRIVQEDAEFDSELNARFDHQVGTLVSIGSRGEQTLDAPVAESTASQIAKLLATPQGVRQAIVINEILRRPTDRW